MAYFTADKIEQTQFSLGHLLHLVNQYKDRVLTRHLLPLDITAQQFRVMMLLHRDHVESCQVLSQRLSIDGGAITRMLDRLEQKQLLQRVRHDDDRRRIALQLTDSGHALCQQMPEVIAEELNEFTQGLDDQDIAQLEHLLRKILIAGGVLEPQPE
ncbi:MarR family transcriptional regulator [Shewanella dokdonensis]|uniref:MarR family transcriptional regulator n=1 Tax=Shewanella dokdonensis TaxID=712036 RepID=A0ABX8DBS9_9GAMM|nr:MarR family transcriptional regulator [Shewanella dokdonensis]MCL1075438.1 MarR family transcriptional regulator [Shewanella dokdonensis]QVK22126.1 MarR family transcriptional regulator [Shewanella dokdonensis]